MYPVGLQGQQEGGNGAIGLLETPVVVDLHTDANNFAPNESERLSISPVLLFTKGQNTRVEIVMVIATEK